MLENIDTNTLITIIIAIIIPFILWVAKKYNNFKFNKVKPNLSFSNRSLQVDDSKFSSVNIISIYNGTKKSITAKDITKDIFIGYDYVSKENIKNTEVSIIGHEGIHLKEVLKKHKEDYSLGYKIELNTNSYFEPGSYISFLCIGKNYVSIKGKVNNRDIDTDNTIYKDNKLIYASSAYNIMAAIFSLGLAFSMIDDIKVFVFTLILPIGLFCLAINNIMDEFVYSIKKPKDIDISKIFKNRYL